MTKYTFEGVIRCQTVIEAENDDEARAKYDQLSNADVIEGNDEREVDDWWTDESLAQRRAEQQEAWERVRLTIARKRAAEDAPPELGGPTSMRP